jgi:hypothetical protein
LGRHPARLARWFFASWRKIAEFRGVQRLTGEIGEKIDLLRRLDGRACDVDIRFDASGTLTRTDAIRSRLERFRTSGRAVRSDHRQYRIRVHNRRDPGGHRHGGFLRAALWTW